MAEIIGLRTQIFENWNATNAGQGDSVILIRFEPNENGGLYTAILAPPAKYRANTSHHHLTASGSTPELALRGMLKATSVKVAEKGF